MRGLYQVFAMTAQLSQVSWRNIWSVVFWHTRRCNLSRDTLELTTTVIRHTQKAGSPVMLTTFCFFLVKIK